MHEITLYRRVAGNNRHPFSVRFAVVGAAVVDDADGQRDDILLARWLLKRFKTLEGRVRSYAVRYVQDNGRSQIRYLHREILGVEDTGINICHRDGDGLNCQRENLLVADKTSSRNYIDRTKRATKAGGIPTSKYSGVHKSKGKWIAQCRFRKRLTAVGAFDSEEEAAMARDAAMLAQFPEGYRPNLPALVRISRFQNWSWVEVTPGEWRFREKAKAA